MKISVLTLNASAVVKQLVLALFTILVLIGWTGSIINSDWLGMINKNVNEIRSDVKNKVRYATRTYKKSEERGWSRAVPDECWFTGSQLIVQNLFFKD